jgi:hypothetical protein
LPLTLFRWLKIALRRTCGAASHLFGGGQALRATGFSPERRHCPRVRVSLGTLLTRFGLERQGIGKCARGCSVQLRPQFSLAPQPRRAQGRPRLHAQGLGAPGVDRGRLKEPHQHDQGSAAHARTRPRDGGEPAVEFWFFLRQRAEDEQSCRGRKIASCPQSGRARPTHLLWRTCAEFSYNFPEPPGLGEACRPPSSLSDGGSGATRLFPAGRRLSSTRDGSCRRKFPLSRPAAAQEGRPGVYPGLSQAHGARRPYIHEMSSTSQHHPLPLRQPSRPSPSAATRAPR